MQPKDNNDMKMNSNRAPGVDSATIHDPATNIGIHSSCNGSAIDGADETELPLTAHEQERQSYFRIIRYTVVLLIFWVIILWLTEHHDDGIAWFLLSILGLWFLYMIVYICMVLCSIRTLAARASNGVRSRPSRSSDDDGVLLVNDDDDDDSDGIIQDDENGDGDDNNPSRLLKFGFDDTPTRIRKCHLPKKPNMTPKDGVYTVVFSAIYFGKALRSETKLKFKFHSTENDSGWEITGISGLNTSQSSPVGEGYINTKGEMYWATNNCTYRGVLDWDTLTMFDGEFLSKKAGNTNGRVVRLEYDHTATVSTAATSASKDIEMSTINELV